MVSKKNKAANNSNVIKFQYKDDSDENDDNFF